MLRLAGVSKSFGSHVACHDIDLEVERGELLTLLGPSGCGKTTALRCISGSFELDRGRIVIGDRDVTEVPSHGRNVGMVFQNFALFPHMSVHDNVAFPLRVRRVSKDEVRERVREVLELVQLGPLAERMPRQLSGGQQQRVSLARALAYRPDVVLFDEPLSNLDAKLRIEMRYEISSLQSELGFTGVYVTHDQEEALSLSDRIAVMSEGSVHQVGSPEEIYREPASAFVASFLGNPNVFKGRYLESDHGDAVVEGAGIRVPVRRSAELSEKDEAVVFVRPEDLDIVDEGEHSDGAAIAAEVTATAFLGDTKECVLRLAPGVEWRVRIPVGSHLRGGERVEVGVAPARLPAFPAGSQGEPR